MAMRFKPNSGNAKQKLVAGNWATDYCVMHAHADGRIIHAYLQHTTWPSNHHFCFVMLKIIFH